MKRQDEIFREWADEFKGVIYKIAHAYARTPEDREDLVQEIFYQVWASIPSFKGNSRPSTWIYRVALNSALTWQRKDRRRPRSFDVAALASEPATDQSKDLENRELVQQLYKAIYTFSKVDCALALMYLNGLKYAEVAEILGISESNVAVRLNRIRKRLSEQIKETNNGS
jgi:RNA polymerase sigma-70 factor (ECF subfamily)